jgi:hypothetical protein
MLYYLCKYDKYLGNPDAKKKNTAKIWLMVNTWFVGYFLALAIYHFFKFLYDNFSNKDSFWKRHIAQTICGLVIFKLWYELFANGIQWIYKDKHEEQSCCSVFMGHILLTIATCGLFLPFRLIQLVVTNWDSKDPWKKHTAQTIGGLVIFKVWYELFNYGGKWVYQDKDEDKTLCSVFMGHLFLTIATVGIFIPIRIIQLIVQNWNSKDPWKRHTAQTIGGLVVFKLWYELFHYGGKWVYDDKPEDQSFCSIFMGHIFLIIASLGLFIPIRIIQLIVWNWDSPDPWKKHIAQTLGGLLIFKLWFELFRHGLKWIYDDKPEEQSLCSVFIGHVFLTIASLGLFIPIRIIQLIVWNWESPNPYKKHIAQTLGGLVIFKLWYELCYYGGKWVYKDKPEESSVCSVFMGLVFLTIATFGIFVPIRIIQLVVWNWESENAFKRHLAQTIGGLVIFKIWYELCHYGGKWVYNDKPEEQTYGSVTMGYIFLTIATFGIFLPVRLIQLIVLNWNSEAPWKRHLAQTIAGLVIIKLWYELFNYGIKWTYYDDEEQQVADHPNNPEGYVKTPGTPKEGVLEEPKCLTPHCFFGHLFLTIATGGAFILFRIIQLVCLNFSCETAWKRHLAQTIALLGVFKIWYELIHYGIKWIYPQHGEETSTCQKFIGHIFMIIATIGFFIPFRIIQLTYQNWNSEVSWKKHTAQTIGGLVILKLWYELFHYGLLWVYEIGKEEPKIQHQIVPADKQYQEGAIAAPTFHEEAKPDAENKHPEGKSEDDATNCQNFTGHIFLTIATLGVFVPIRIIQLIVNHWNSEVSWKKHTAQTFGGLVIFKIWYELFHYGIKWIYNDKDEERTCCSVFTGYIFLTIASLGIFIPIRIIQLVINHWNSENDYKRHVAQTIGGLVIFKVWYELHRYGTKWVYNRAYNGNAWVDLSYEERVGTSLFMIGHVFLTITYLGLYIPYRIIELVVLNFNSETTWKRELAQTIGGLVIFKIWYELFYWGYLWVYFNSNLVKITPMDNFRSFIGHIFLTIGSLGLFIPIRIIQLVVWNWNSETFWKKQLAQLVGGLVIFKIWYEIWRWGIEWTYRKQKVETKEIVEHAVVPIQQNQVEGQQVEGQHVVVIHVEPNQVEGQLNDVNLDSPAAAPAAPEYKIVVKEVDYSLTKQFIGHLFLLIGSIGLFAIWRFIELWIKLFKYGVSRAYHNDGNAYKQNSSNWDMFVGGFCLTVTTIGFYIPYRLIEWVCQNFYSEVYWRRHLAQTIAGVGILKLYYELFVLTYDWSYRVEQRPVYKHVVGRLGLIALTAGLALLPMVVEYFSTMVSNLRHPPYSKENHTGILQISLLSFGLPAMWKGTSSKSQVTRYMCKTLLALVNVAVYAIIYVLAIAKHTEYAKYILIALCVSNYVVALVVQRLIYSEAIRYISNKFYSFWAHTWWGFSHMSDYFAQAFRHARAKSGNAISRAKASIRTSWSNTSCKFSNETWPKVTGDPIKVPGSPGYEAPEIFHPEIRVVSAVRNWEQKMHDKFFSEDALFKQKLANTLYCITCVKAKLQIEFASSSNMYPSAHNVFWASRFDKLPQMPLYKDMNSLEFSKTLNVQSYETIQIIPEPGQPKDVYDMTTQQFDKYIYSLNCLENKIYKKDYTKLDQMATNVVV